MNIAAASNMTTTAEGVETELQRNLLYILGCTEMQGFLFSPAIPAAEIRRLLLSHRGRAVSAAEIVRPPAGLRNDDNWRRPSGIIGEMGPDSGVRASAPSVSDGYSPNSE